MDLNPAILFAMAEGPPIDFASSTVTANSATAITKPSDVAAGDLMLVWVLDTATGATLTTASGSAWARVENAHPTGPKYHVLFWKVLNATDVANAWNIGGGVAGHGAIALRYRSNGANALTLKDSNLGTIGVNTSAVPLTGFTKAAGTYGVLSLFVIDGAAASPTLPSGFTARQTSAASGWRIVAADNLTGYVDGASVTWGSVNSLAPTILGYVELLFEVTGS